ncbi:MAG TPA: PQQ-binding-like beta-propeller repeat protein [Actinomycetota bacterium]
MLTGGPEPPYRPLWSLAAPAGPALSPAVVSGDLAISLGSEAVYGIDVASGTVEWEISREGGPLTIPAVATVGDGQVLLYLDGPPEDEPSPSATPSASTGPSGATPSPSTGEDDADGSVLVGVSLEDRSELWRAPLDGIARSGVTVDGTTAYVGDQDGNVYAIALEDGTTVWSERVTGRVDAPLAVADATVYAIARDEDALRVRVAAFDAATGERPWQPFVVPATSTAATAPAAGGGVVVIGAADRSVRAIGAEGGAERWSSLVLSLFSPATSPALSEEGLFVADLGGGLYRLDPSSGERAWGYQFNDVVFRGSPVRSGSAVLLGLNDGRLAAVDAETGHLVWQSEESPGLIGAIALSGDAVIAVKGGRDAGLVAFEHDPDGTLLDEPSPTELDLGTTLQRYAVAGVGVFAVVFVAGLLAARRFGASPPDAAREDESEMDEGDPAPAEPDEEDES